MAPQAFYNPTTRATVTPANGKRPGPAWRPVVEEAAPGQGDGPKAANAAQTEGAIANDTAIALAAANAALEAQGKPTIDVELPPGKPNPDWTIPQLRALADVRGVDLTGKGSKKGPILDAVVASFPDSGGNPGDTDYNGADAADAEDSSSAQTQE